MMRAKCGFVAVLACLAVAPAIAEDTVAEPGVTTPLPWTDGAAEQAAEEGQTAASDFDTAAGALRAEAATADVAGSATATATLWADFVVGGEGDGELDAKVFGNAEWSGTWQVDAAGATAMVEIVARLYDVGGTDPVLVAVQTLAQDGVGVSGCAACYGIETPTAGAATAEFDRALVKGGRYRIAFRVSVAAMNPGDAPAFMDLLGDDAGVLLGGLGVALEDDLDLDDELAQINAKLDALAEQVDDGFAQTGERFDAVDAAIALNTQKIDALALDVAVIDDKVDMVDAKVTVIDAKVDEINAKIDAIDAELDLIREGIMELRLVSCDLERLIMTPQGQRSSDIAVCEDQPAFPYAWPEKPLDHPSNNGNGNNGSNGNGNGNGSDDVDAAGESATDDSQTSTPTTSRRRGSRR